MVRELIWLLGGLHTEWPSGAQWVMPWMVMAGEWPTHRQMKHPTAQLIHI